LKQEEEGRGKKEVRRGKKFFSPEFAFTFAFNFVSRFLEKELDFVGMVLL
jgi:hypothetical protein